MTVCNACRYCEAFCPVFQAMENRLTFSKVDLTYLGVKVDERARVVMNGGSPAANIFAAGEIMAGNILGQGYVGGVGMTIGTVFGEIAGTQAATLHK